MIHFLRMSAITLDLPESLAERLRIQGDRVPEILELGLREWSAETLNSFPGAAEILEFLASLPSPQDMLNLRPSENLRAKIRELLEKSRDGELDAVGQQAWERYQFLEHLVRLAKAKASLRLGASAADG